MRRLACVFVFVALASSASAALVAPTPETMKEMRAEQRAVLDLQAQSDMAFWAMVMAALTAVSTIVATAGLICLWQSLKQTRAAIVAANKANDQNELAHKQNELRTNLEMRPWLEIRDIEVLGSRPGGNDVQMKVELTLRNIGKLPARDVRVTGLVNISGFRGLSLDAEMPGMITWPEDREMSLPPNSETKLTIEVTRSAPLSTDAARMYLNAPALIEIGASYRTRTGEELFKSIASANILVQSRAHGLPAHALLSDVGPVPVEGLVHTVIE